MNILEKVKWGFIGCGEVTEKKSGPAFSMIKNSEVVAVMSRSAEKAESYARRNHIPRWYTDAQLLIGDEDLHCHSPLLACNLCHHGHEGWKTCLHREAYGSQLRRLRPYQPNLQRNGGTLLRCLLPTQPPLFPESKGNGHAR